MTYATHPASSEDIGGVYICGTGSPNITNVESQYTYTTGTMTITQTASENLYTGFNTEVIGDSTVSCATGLTSFYWGAHTGGTVQLYTQGSAQGGQAPSPGNPGYSGCPSGYAIGPAAQRNKISEIWTVGGTYNNGTSPTNPHRGSIHFKVMNDTEATIAGGNAQKTVTGTAVWATGQNRIATITTDSAHGLTDYDNRITISGASNGALNGIWNVATVTSDTAFTIKLFAATCDQINVTGLNIITYDGLDKTNGVLRRPGGYISSITRVRSGTYGTPGTSPSPGNPGTPSTSPSHSITYYYNGPHGVPSSGEVTVKGTGNYDFTGAATRHSGTQISKLWATGVSGYQNDTEHEWAGGNADVYNTSHDLYVIAGGMYGNNKVIIRGTTAPIAGARYVFCGNTSGTVVLDEVQFSSISKERSMFTDAGLNLNTDTGRVYTTNAPSSQPTDQSGGYNGVSGGMAPIDAWCPHYMHGRTAAQVREDLTEVLKANTSGYDASVQLANSPMVDSNDNLTTFLHPRHGFHQTIHFTLQAYKNTAHTSTRSGQSPGGHTWTAQDYVSRNFYINVYQNMKSVRNDFAGIVYPVDTDNNYEVANTDTAQKNNEANTFISNYDNVVQNYANGSFDNF